MLQFSQFVWKPCYSVWDVFDNFLLIDATDRSKISSDQKCFFIALSLYPLSFFANTPFNLSSCFNLCKLFYFLNCSNLYTASVLISVACNLFYFFYPTCISYFRIKSNFKLKFVLPRSLLFTGLPSKDKM